MLNSVHRPEDFVTGVKANLGAGRPKRELCIKASSHLYSCLSVGPT